MKRACELQCDGIVFGGKKGAAHEDAFFCLFRRAWILIVCLLTLFAFFPAGAGALNALTGMTLEQEVGPEHAQKRRGESGKPARKQVQHGKRGSPPRREVSEKLGNRDHDPRVIQRPFDGGHPHPQEKQGINGNGGGECAAQKPYRKGSRGGNAQHHSRTWSAVTNMEVPGKEQRGAKEHGARCRRGKRTRTRIARSQNGKGQMGYHVQSCLHDDECNENTGACGGG